MMSSSDTHTGAGGELAQSRLDGKVVRGKDGWLFLDNDSNLVMSQHSGKLRFSAEQLRQWRFLLENRIAWLERRGALYFFLVAPNPHSVYPDKLPDGSGTGESRPILQLVKYLESEGSFARIIYPLEELAKERSRLVFSRTETHWTELGAFVAYRRLMAEINASNSVPVLSEDDLSMEERSWTGDLGLKIEPPESSTSVYVTVRHPKAQFVSDNRVYNLGRRIEYRCDAAPPTRCLVFGDSFSTRLLPYLAEGFARLVFAHVPTLDYELVEREQADIVICVMNERFLISVPNDVSGTTLEQLGDNKIAAGQLYPPRAATGNRVDSPEVGFEAG